MSVLCKVWVNACLFLVCHGPDAFWKYAHCRQGFIKFSLVLWVSVCWLYNARWRMPSGFLFVVPSLKLAMWCNIFLKIGVRSQGQSYHGRCVGDNIVCVCDIWYVGLTLTRQTTLCHWFLGLQIGNCFKFLAKVQFHIVAERDLYCLEVFECNNIRLSHLRRVCLYVVPTTVGSVYRWMRRSWWSISIMIQEPYIGDITLHWYVQIGCLFYPCKLSWIKTILQI